MDGSTCNYKQVFYTGFKVKLYMQPMWISKHDGLSDASKFRGFITFYGNYGNPLEASIVAEIVAYMEP